MVFGGKKLAGFIALLTLVSAHPALAEVGEILQGVAGIAGAIAPIAVAGIQSKADVAIAGINARTAIGTTQIQAATSKELASIAAEVALAQAETSAEINKINNAGQTERLGMQLAELRAARESSMEAEREKRMYEMELNRERIALATKQADDNFKLAKATLQANLVQAGLVSGFKTMDSSKGLSVRSVLTPGGGATPAVAMGTGLVANATPVENRASVRLLRAANGELVTTGTAGARSETSQRLLASLSSGNAILRNTRARGIGAQVNALMAGSTPSLRVRTPVPTSELAAFRATIADAGPRHVERRDDTPTTPQGGHSGGGTRGFR